MARMRSIKPEFWGDRKLSRLSRDARLLYISLWNFSDEHGRVQGDSRYVKGHCLPYEDDLSTDDVQALLEELEDLGRVEIYEVEGDPYLFLPKLGGHQRLEPSKQASRLPDPTPKRTRRAKNTLNAEESSDKSAQSPDKSAESATLSEPIVVQHVAGSREHVAGSMLQVAGVPTTAGDSAAAPSSPPDSTKTLIADWIDHCAERPPGPIVGQMSKLVKGMVEEGISPASIRAGIAAWTTKGLHPSALPSVVNEVMNARPVKKLATSDQRWADTQALKSLFANGEIA